MRAGDEASSLAPTAASLPPLAVYVHVPWCVRKCPYCDFNSHPLGAARPPERRFLAALQADLEGEAALAAGRPVGSVYLGGGTPSLLSPEAVAEILAAVARGLALAPGAEVTLEANPGTVDAGRLRELRGAGVNRLSIGVQSLDDRLLARIGRIHGARDAREAVAAARAAGLESLNLDLMYGLPGQTVAQAVRDVEEALALAPDHLSHYQFTVEPGTAFHRRPPRLPGEVAVARMEDACRERIAAAGLGRYEVSAFARPGRRCAHNLNYWSFGDYLGLGPGAHGKLTHAEPWRVVRRAKPAYPATYLAAAEEGDLQAEVRELGPGDLGVEFMLNALRLTDGVPAALFTARAGLPPEAIASPRAKAIARGLLAGDPDRLVATPLGFRFLDDLVALFALPDPE